MVRSVSQLFRSITQTLPALGRSPARAIRRRLWFDVLEDRLTPNNRFVIPIDVPADKISTFHTLAEALAQSGLVSGNIIEIKQGAIPGTLSSVSFPNVTNVTVRGEAGVGARDLDPVVFRESFNITAGRSGLTFQNLNIVTHDQISVSAPAAFSGNVMALTSSDDGIKLLTTGGVAIVNNDITNIYTDKVISVSTVAGSQNLIAGNTFHGGSVQSTTIGYDNAGVTTDVVRDNILIGNTGMIAITMMTIAGGVDGLTIQRNVFRDVDASFNGIGVAGGVVNLKILQNTFELRSDSAIAINASGAASTTSATIAGNLFTTGATSAAISLLTPSAGGTFRMNISANDFLVAGVGVTISSTGSTVNNIDLGGGTEGSPGGNNFRFLRSAATGVSSAAIVTATSTLGQGAVQARNNLFNTIGGEAAVFDLDDDAARADIVTTGNVTGNAAFVQALFVRFLRRVADLSNPNGGGGFVTQLNNGASPASIVNAIARSAEAFGYVVDDLYHTIMNRDADPAGRANWVDQLVGGATLESVRGGFFASAEYATRFAADRAYVVSLYSTVLHRLGGDSEYAGWVAQLPSLGRAGVAAFISNSAEAHGQAAARLYISILKRTAGASEISSWASSGLDELAIQTSIAASPEGQGIL